MMLDFEKDKIYKFGIIKVESEGQANLPEFSPRYPSPSVSGRKLFQAKIKSFDDYLSTNPHEFPPSKTVHCYIIDNEGNYEHFAEGNPYNLKVPEQGLSDDPVKHNLSKQIGAAYNSVRGGNKDELVKELKNQINSYRNLAEEYRKESDQKNDEIIDLRNKILRHDADKLRWKIKEEEYEKIISEYNDKFKDMNDGSSGLGDKLKASLAERAGEIAANIASNPRLADAILNLVEKIPYLKNMMAVPTGNNNAYSGMSDDNLNNDGVDVKEGEFDENS